MMEHTFEVDFRSRDGKVMIGVIEMTPISRAMSWQASFGLRVADTECLNRCDVVNWGIDVITGIGQLLRLSAWHAQ